MGTCRRCGRAGHDSGTCFSVRSATGKTLGGGGSTGNYRSSGGGRGFSVGDTPGGCTDCGWCGREGHEASICWFLTHRDGRTIGPYSPTKMSKSLGRGSGAKGHVPTGWTEWVLLLDREGRWDVRILPGTPAVYELAISRTGHISAEDVMYAGETVNVGNRMGDYGEDGSHLSDVIDRSIRAGFDVYCRFFPVASKSAAVQAEQRRLMKFDYSWNIKDNSPDTDEWDDHSSGRCGRCERKGHIRIQCTYTSDASNRPIRVQKWR